MKKIMCLFSFIFLLTSISYAADWELFEDGGFLIDKSSITKTNNSIKAWVIIAGQGKINNKKFNYMQNYMDFRCKEKTSADLEILAYNKNDELIASSNIEELNIVKYKRIVPDSRGEKIFNAVCSMK